MPPSVACVIHGSPLRRGAFPQVHTQIARLSTPIRRVARRSCTNPRPPRQAVVGTIRPAGQCDRHRLHGRRCRHQQTVRRQIVERTCRLCRLERHDELGTAFCEQRRMHLLAFVSHADMARHVAAALGHTDRFGCTHLPAFMLRRLGEHLRRKHSALSAYAGKEDVDHRAPPSSGAAEGTRRAPTAQSCVQRPQPLHRLASTNACPRDALFGPRASGSKPIPGQPICVMHRLQPVHKSESTATAALGLVSWMHGERNTTALGPWKSIAWAAAERASGFWRYFCWPSTPGTS